MATSGSTNFTITRDQLIKYAFLNLGVLGEGDEPNVTQIADGAVLLNLIVKSWHADGMPLWAIKQTCFALTSLPYYTMGVGKMINVPRPLKILEAYVSDTRSATDTPLRLLTQSEYNDLATKTTVATPTQFYYDPQGGSTPWGTLFLWPTPDQDSVSHRTVTVTYQRPFEDFDSANDTPDFPQEWFLPLLWMLQWSLAPMAGITSSERTLFLQEAIRLKAEALSFGMEEGSVYIQPERTFK